MKAIVKADYRDQLVKGDELVLVHSFVTDYVRSGIAYVIDFENELRVYDSNFFE